MGELGALIGIGGFIFLVWWIATQWIKQDEQQGSLEKFVNKLREIKENQGDDGGADKLWGCDNESSNKGDEDEKDDDK